MSTTTLQVPMSKTLKDEAKAAAKDMGFSSLQEYVRVMLSKTAKRQMTLEVEENSVALSEKAIKRYNKMALDFEKGRNVYHANSWEEFKKQLDS